MQRDAAGSSTNGKVEGTKIKPAKSFSVKNTKFPPNAKAVQEITLPTSTEVQVFQVRPTSVLKITLPPSA